MLSILLNSFNFPREQNPSTQIKRKTSDFSLRVFIIIIIYLFVLMLNLLARQPSEILNIYESSLQPLLPHMLSKTSRMYSFLSVSFQGERKQKDVENIVSSFVSSYMLSLKERTLSSSWSLTLTWLGFVEFLLTVLFFLFPLNPGMVCRFS